MDPPLFSFWAFVRIAVCEKYISSWLIIPLLQGQGNNNPQRSHGIPNGETYPQIPSFVPEPRNAATEFVTRAPAKHGRLKWVRTCHLLLIGGFHAISGDTKAMLKWANAGRQTKRANERSFFYSPPAWRRWRNVKTTYLSSGVMWPNLLPTYLSQS